METIGAYAFYNCGNLQSIAIPDNVKGIYENTFTSCKSLKSVSIGKSCSTIVPTAFSGTTALEKINVSEDNEKYSSVDGALLNKEKHQLFYILRVNLENLLSPIRLLRLPTMLLAVVRILQKLQSELMLKV